jgi:cytochrome P450
MNQPVNCPTSDVDLWSDEVLADPYPTYRTLRNLGPAVWLERVGVVTFPRFDEVRAALPDWQTYSSASGVSLDADVNRSMGASTLKSDPPEHERYRKPLATQLSVASLNGAATERIVETAERIVDRALSQETFDAVTDIAQPYSLTVVSDFVGLPEEGRNELLSLAERAFNIFGPPGDRCRDAREGLASIHRYNADVCAHAKLAPGGKGAELVGNGMGEAITAYTWPGIDTTVNAISAAIELFATNPDQWDLVRNNPSLIPSAFNEVLRLHAPVHYFARQTTRDVTVGDIEIGEGQQVLLMYGSANRDERRYPDPDRFDVTRNPLDHLAFGRGIHLCVGINLARLEAHTLLAALARRVERFEPIGEAVWMRNNTLHGLKSRPVRAHMDSVTDSR